MSERRGFTLLEVLVATVVMGVAVTGLIVGLSQSVKNASRLTDYDRAAMIARTKLNDLLLDVNLPFEGSASGAFGDDVWPGGKSGWRAATRPFDMRPEAGPGSFIVQAVSLEVWWEPNTGSRRTMQLEGYRRTRIPVPGSR